MRVRERVGQTHQPIATLPRDGGERGLDLGGAANRDLDQLRREGRSGGLDRAQERKVGQVVGIGRERDARDARRDLLEHL